MNRLFINGKDVTDDIKNFDEFDIEIGLNTSTKTITKALSQAITVTGETYEYLVSVFFGSCDLLENKVKAVFKTDICGGITIPLEINISSVEDFPDYEEMEVILSSVTDEDEAHAKLDSDYWFDNDFASAYEIPILFYADQPNYYSWLIILMTAGIRIFLNVIDEILSILCEIASFGFGRCDVNISGAVFYALDTWLTGLGRWATAPIVHEIIDFQCQQAGLNFVSSILNEPSSEYYNMAMFHQDRGVKGSYKDTSINQRKFVLLENAPLWTTIDLLNYLTETFEADYRIINGTLYFEPKDFFDNLASDQIFHVKDICSDERLGYSYNLDEMVAYGVFELSQDSYDGEGNKAIANYRTKLEFNDPYSPAQKGKLTRISNFGPARFMFDQYSYDRNGILDVESIIDEFRDGPDNFFEGIVFENEGQRRSFDLTMSGNTLGIPKLLILEDNFKRSDALVIKKPFKIKNGKQYWIYNFPMMYKEIPDKYENGIYLEGTKGSLTAFAEMSNPKLRKDKLKLSDFTIDCDCNVVRKAVDNFQLIYIQSRKGKAIPENINISFKKNKVSIGFSGIRVLCG